MLDMNSHDDLKNLLQFIVNTPELTNWVRIILLISFLYVLSLFFKRRKQ